MRVERFARIEGCRVFRDFRWPADLPGFDEKNLIYGWNGTGKSTIASIFRAFGDRAPMVSGEAVITVDGRPIHTSSLGGDAALPQVRVFDRDFVDQNVFTTDSVVAPILFLGRENIEDQKRADALHAEIEDLRRELNASTDEKTRRQTDLDRFCAERASTGVKTVLRSSGKGNRYSNYDKSDFERTCTRLLGIPPEERAALVLDEESEDQALALIHAPARDRLDRFAPVGPDVADLVARAAAAMSRTAASEKLEGLEGDSELSTWLERGLDLHHARESETCLFCERQLPAERMESLRSHFNDEFRSLAGLVDRLITEVNRGIENMRQIALPSKTLVQTYLTESYALQATLLEQHRSEVIALLQRVAQGLQEKRQNPFLALSAPFALSGLPHLDAAPLAAIIDEHNAAIDDYQERVERARTLIEQSVVASSCGDYEARVLEREEAAGRATSLGEEIETLEGRLRSIEQGLVQHLEPADQLNAELKAYLGRDEIQFTLQGSGYGITRGGQPAEHLSEGERTAIALLYFLKSLQSKDFPLSDGIVVVDDPVSSLDSNSLFCAFGYLKDRTKDAGQLFVLTHNHAFFRLVRNWFKHVNSRAPGRAKPAQFYLVDCTMVGGERQSRLTVMDDLLVRYESEYYYLFQKVVEASEAGTDRSLADHYWAPNVARRFMECFMAFKRPGKSSLYSQLDGLDFDSAKTSRILRFLDTYSHNNQVGVADDDALVLAETPAVMRDLLDLVKSLDSEHFAQMMQLTGRIPAEAVT